MFEVWRTNRWNDDLLEEHVATFNKSEIAQKFCDYMLNYEGENYVIKGKEKQQLTKEKGFDRQFQDKLKALQKDFAVNKNKDFDYDYER